MARVPLILSKDQVAPEHHATVDAIIGSRGALHGPFSVFLHSPEIAGRVAHLGALVRFEGTLDLRVRVLAAMVVAREFEAEYVWGAQTGGARRQNVPESTITAIRENTLVGVPAEDAMIIEYTRTLLCKHRIPAAMDKAIASLIFVAAASRASLVRNTRLSLTLSGGPVLTTRTPGPFVLPI